MDKFLQKSLKGRDNDSKTVSEVDSSDEESSSNSDNLDIFFRVVLPLLLHMYYSLTNFLSVET